MDKRHWPVEDAAGSIQIKKKAQYAVLPKKFEETVNNVYKLPSTGKVVRYLHACAGFPTKATWIKAITGGNYATWPHLSIEAGWKQQQLR